MPRSGFIQVRIILFLGLVVLLYFAAARLSRAAYSETVHQSSASSETKSGNDRSKYVGDAACLSCHKSQSLSYLHTSHHLTSRVASKDSVLGSFQSGSNVLTIIDPAHATAQPGLFFKMEKKDENYFETAATGWGTDLQMRTEKIDLVTGSGVRGVTYLYWQGGKLYELPVSYWTDGHRWINSPGYENGSANFSRPVNPGCLECHASYIQPLSSDPLTNSYDRESLITGISCETCHGAGADHIAKQKTVPGRAGDQAILNPAKFSRDQHVAINAVGFDFLAHCFGLAATLPFVAGQASVRI